MTAPVPPKLDTPRRASPTGTSDELANLRASVTKLARAQNALLFNVKALNETKCDRCRARCST